MRVRYSYSTMSKLTIFVSSTIVLILSGGSVWASPQNQAPEDQSVPTPWPSGPPPENMQISQPPKIHSSEVPAPNARYYAYHQQLTFRIGVDAEASDLKSPSDIVIGFQYLFPKFLSPKLEAGADLHSDGLGHVHGGARWIFNERGYFRPSLKAALDIMLIGAEGLATFTKYDNFYLRSGGTIEYVMWNPYSIRLEIEGLIGPKETFLEGTVGISRGW